MHSGQFKSLYIFHFSYLGFSIAVMCAGVLLLAGLTGATDNNVWVSIAVYLCCSQLSLCVSIGRLYCSGSTPAVFLHCCLHVDTTHSISCVDCCCHQEAIQMPVGVVYCGSHLWFWYGKEIFLKQSTIFCVSRYTSYSHCNISWFAA